MFSSLRPVGNFVKYHSEPFDKALLAPFSVFGYQSGTAALSAAIIRAKNCRPDVNNPEIIIPAYTCPDVLSAGAFAGVKVRIVDFEPNSPFMDIDQIVDNSNDNTVAIVAVNFLGIRERIEKIRNSLGNLKALIIEDSAQGFPTFENSNYWKGDLVTISFGRGKPLSLFHGGALLSPDSQLDSLLKEFLIKDNTEKHKMYFFKSHLFKVLSTSAAYFWLTKMPFLGLGETHYKPLSELECLPIEIAQQLNQAINQFKSDAVLYQKIVNSYRNFNFSGLNNLPETLNISPEFPLLRYPFLIANESKKEECLNELTRLGLGASSMYKNCLLDMGDIPEGLVVSSNDTPNARIFSKQLLTLPCHLDVQTKHIESIRKTLNSILKD